MKSTLPIPNYRHNISNTINFFVFGYSYAYVTKMEEGYYSYLSGKGEGTFSKKFKTSYNSIIKHSLSKGDVILNSIKSYK